MKASILDYPREELDSTIWDTTSDDLTLQPEIQSEIEDIVYSFLDDLDLPEEALLDVLIYGSILTNQYNAKTDVDARILLDPDIVKKVYPEATGDDLYDVAEESLHGVLLGATKHPLNATVVIQGEQTELGQAELGTTARDPVFSLKENKLINEGEWYDESFDPDVEFTQERGEADEIMEKLDALIRETKTDTIDFEVIQEAVAHVKNKDALMDKLKSKLEEINNSIGELVKEYNRVKEERTESYKSAPEDDRHKAPGNIRYKLLEKYKYTDILKKLKRLFEDGIDKGEVNDVADVLSMESKIGPATMPTSPTGPPALPEKNPLSFEDGGMMHGATCPDCGWVNPMTAKEGEHEISCKNCGKKFDASSYFTLNTGPGAYEDTLPYRSDFGSVTAMDEDDIESIDKSLKDLGVGQDVRDRLKQKIKNPENTTTPHAPEAPSAPTAPEAPEAPSSPNKELKPMKKIQTSDSSKKGIWAEPSQKEPGGSPYPESQGLAEAKKEDKKKKDDKKKEDEVTFEILTVLEGIDLIPFLEDEVLLEELLCAFPILGEESDHIDLYAQLQFWDKINFDDIGVPRSTVVSLIGTVPLQGQYKLTEDTLFVENPKDTNAIYNVLKLNAIAVAPPEGTGQFMPPIGKPDYEEGPKGKKKKRPTKDPEREAEAVGINWMDSYPTKFHALFGLIAQHWRSPTTYTQGPLFGPQQPSRTDEPTWEDVGEEVPVQPSPKAPEQPQEAAPEWAWADEPVEEEISLESPEGLYPNPETEAAAAYLVNDPKFRAKMERKVKSLLRKTWNEAHVRAYVTSMLTELMYKNVYKLDEPYQQLALAALANVDWDSIVDVYTQGMTGPQYMTEEEEIEDVEKQLKSISSETFSIESEEKEVTEDEARKIGEEIGIDWDAVGYTPEDLAKGIIVEFEHGTHDPETDVTGDDLTETAKIAWAHLKEMDDYYDKLEEMEESANQVTYGEKGMKNKQGQAFMTTCPNCKTVQKADFWDATKCPNCGAQIPSYEDIQRFRPEDEKIEPPTKTRKPIRVVTTADVKEFKVIDTVAQEKQTKIDAKTKRQINKEMSGKGLDGNGRFVSPGSGLLGATDILEKYGIVLADFYQHYELTQPQGQISLNLAFSDDPQSGDYATEIENAMLVFSWYLYEEIDQFECLAYVS